MRYRFAETAEYRFLLRVIFNETKGACSFQAHVAALPRRLDLRRQAGKRKALIDMPMRHAKTLRDLLAGRTLRDKCCVGIYFIQ